jgi:DNA-binding NarL/FixJ family response regulator
MNTIRVLLADDHALVRAGLRMLLDRLAGVEVVGEAADGQEALALVEKHQPDILLTDVAMPVLNGMELAERVARNFPKTRTIILSMHAEKQYAVKALRVGAAGYLIKDAGTVELELAIRSVAGGEAYLSPAVSKHIVDDYTRLASAAPESAGPLTPRQREVLKLIAEGLTTKAIAQRMNISVKTAETHRLQLMDRLGIHEVASLVRYAVKNGIVEADS